MIIIVIINLMIFDDDDADDKNDDDDDDDDDDNDGSGNDIDTPKQRLHNLKKTNYWQSLSRTMITIIAKL